MNIHERPSPNQDARPARADMLVLHYTGMQSGQAAIDRLRDPVARVSSHYVIDEDGTIYRLVPEIRRAWHAGISYWRGRQGLNDVSIGIEIVNPGHEWGYRPFPAPQMAAVTALCHAILARHHIPAWNVVGHSDIAPNRKQDPGELFAWQALAAEGIGLWPADEAAPASDMPAMLQHLGYDPGLPLDIVLTAFQRHWRPDAVTGLADAQTVSRLAALCAMVPAA
jgi:N-acetylmuramoyl-L-alanine amidase